MTNHEEIICPVCGAHVRRDRMVKGLRSAKGKPDPWLCPSCGIEMDVSEKGLREI